MNPTEMLAEIARLKKKVAKLTDDIANPPFELIVKTTGSIFNPSSMRDEVIHSHTFVTPVTKAQADEWKKEQEEKPFPKPPRPYC